MVSPVVAGLNDAIPVSRRMIRRAVGLAVAGSVLVIAGLAVWLLGAAAGSYRRARQTSPRWRARAWWARVRCGGW